MGWEAWFTLFVVIAVLWALAKNVAGPDVILMGGAVALASLSLLSAKFPTARQLAASFGNEGVLTVGVLFVVAAGLTETGGMSLLTERVLGLPRGVLDAQFRLMLPVAGISAFLNNTPVVAMFIPVVNDWCKKTGISPSKLFMPLSYVAVLGGVCTLIGTSTNLVVQALLVEAHKTDPSVPVMSMFTISPVGVPVAIVGLLFIFVTSRWLLPERATMRATTLDPKQYTVEMRVESGSPVDGQTIEAAGLRRLPGMFLSAIERNGETLVAVGPEQVLHGNDLLIFAGVVDSVVDLQRVRGLVPATDQVFKISATRLNRMLVEVVIGEASPMSGLTIKEGQFRSRYNAAVIAVCRDGARIDAKIGDIKLKPGDALLLQAHPGFTDRYRHSREFLLVSPVADSRPMRHERAWLAIGIMAVMVAVASMEDLFGVSIFNAALLAAAAMGITGCLSADQARRSIDLDADGHRCSASHWPGDGEDRPGRRPGRADHRRLRAIRSMGRAGGRLPADPHLHGTGDEQRRRRPGVSDRQSDRRRIGREFPAVRDRHRGGSFGRVRHATRLPDAPDGVRTGKTVLPDFLRMGIPLDLLCMAVTVIVTPLVYPF